VWTHGTELEERLDQVVVTGVEIESACDDVACLVEVLVRLLHRADGLDLGKPGDRLRLDVDHDTRRDVVDDDRLVTRRRDRFEVGDDAALRGLAVVRRHDEQCVDVELVRLLGQVDGVGCRIRPCPGDDGRVVADGLDRGAEELEPLVVGEVRALAGRPGNDDAVGAVLDEVARQALKGVKVDRPVLTERSDDRRQNAAQHRPIVRGSAT
jgi:hypothetical protein